VFTAWVGNVGATLARVLCNNTIPGSHLLTFKAGLSSTPYNSGAFADS
jgi:hypothetical protein